MAHALVSIVQVCLVDQSKSFDRESDRKLCEAWLHNCTCFVAGKMLVQFSRFSDPTMEATPSRRQQIPMFKRWAPCQPAEGQPRRPPYISSEMLSPSLVPHTPPTFAYKPGSSLALFL